MIYNANNFIFEISRHQLVIQCFLSDSIEDFKKILVIKQLMGYYKLSCGGQFDGE